MQFDHKDIALIAVGLGALVVIGYAARIKTDTGQPRYESSLGADLTTGFNVVDRLDTGDHYFHPSYCVPGQTQIWTQHKYPTVSGGNVSTLIHQGMSALRRSAPQDDDWRTGPPAEVMWL
jgi:hypothetical protein